MIHRDVGFIFAILKLLVVSCSAPPLLCASNDLTARQFHVFVTSGCGFRHTAMVESYRSKVSGTVGEVLNELAELKSIFAGSCVDRHGQPLGDSEMGHHMHVNDPDNY